MRKSGLISQDLFVLFFLVILLINISAVSVTSNHIFRQFDRNKFRGTIHLVNMGK